MMSFWQVCYHPDDQRFEDLNYCINNLHWELNFNNILIERHLQMQVFSQYDREAMAVELFKERLAILVASSRLQLNNIQERGWDVTREKVTHRRAPFKNVSQSYHPPIQRTIKKRNRKRKGLRNVPPQRTTQKNIPVKCFTASISSISNYASVSEDARRELGDDYMYDDLEQHL